MHLRRCVAFGAVTALVACGSSDGADGDGAGGAEATGAAVVRKAPPQPPPPPPPLTSWTQIASPPSATDGRAIVHVMLMTDGEILALGADGSALALGPNRFTGGYGGSVWRQLASMHDSRSFYGSHVLPDGRVVVIGGENGTGTGKGEVYDPQANTWSSPFSAPWATDTETALLPDGTVYIAESFLIYNPATNVVQSGPAYPVNANEASFVLLSDQSFLTIPRGSTQAYRYVPAWGTFVPAGNTPVNMWDGKAEIGPGVRLANGNVFWIGGNGSTAIYTPPATLAGQGTWASGPTVPDGNRADDAAAAVLPNGHVLFVADNGTDSTYGTTTRLYDYDPTTNLVSDGSAPWTGGAAAVQMVALPNGQVLASNAGAMYVNAPPAVANSAWAPTITSYRPVSPGVYELTGTNLHGFSEGAAYGDDAEMATNFPLVRAHCADGLTDYGRTFGWAPAVVGLGPAIQTTRFTVPPGAFGTCSLVVVANGIPSAPLAVTIQGKTIASPACVSPNPACDAGTCGSMTDGCGRPINCGVCGAANVCSANHCCPRGETWNGAACAVPCSTPKQCCIDGGGRWTGTLCE